MLCPSRTLPLAIFLSLLARLRLKAAAGARGELDVPAANSLLEW